MLSKHMTNFIITFSREEVEKALDCKCGICDKLRMHWDRREALKRSMADSPLIANIKRIMSPSKTIESQLRVAFEFLQVKTHAELKEKLTDVGLLRNIGEKTMNVILDYIATVDRYGENYAPLGAREAMSCTSDLDESMDNDSREYMLTKNLTTSDLA